MNRFQHLVPNYRGDGPGQVVTIEIGRNTRRVTIPVLDKNTQEFSWLGRKVSSPKTVTFRWDGKQWMFYKTNY
jgi:hypothetical protein